MSEETAKLSMNERTKTGLEILQAAVLTGVLGDVLLRQTPWGLNAFFFIAALAAAMIMLWRRRRPEFLNKSNIALQIALVFFGAMFLWRDSEELKIFDTLAVFTILAILSLPALKITPRISGVFHYGAGFLWSGLNGAFSPLFLVFGDISWKTIPQNGWTKHLVSTLRGLAIAAPIVLIFGALFMAADAVYQGIVERTFNVQPDAVVSHIFLFGFFAWITAGYLRGTMTGNFAGDTFGKVSPSVSVTGITESKTNIAEPEDNPQKTLSLFEPHISELPEHKIENEEPREEKKRKTFQDLDNSILPRFFTLGAIETSIILGLINLLFLSFVIVQIPYLFGGFELVQNTPDFKLADYARRGFGELVTVAALVLPILLVSHWLLRKDNPLNEKIYRVLAGIQIALLFVIMASAAQRLLILTGNLGYGLTTIRFYPMVCMVWLAVVFGWFAMTVLRGERRQFAWGALWSALAILGVLHFVNPDDYIVRTNINLMKQGREFDGYYNSNLSDDAVPVLLENLNAMSFEDQCSVLSNLNRRKKAANEETDFRSWNLSRRNAKDWLDANNLDTTGCPKNYRYSDFHRDF